MSEEGRVTLSYVARYVTAFGITTRKGKGALGLDGHLKGSTGIIREESRVDVEL
jgi:hypothetical protein